MSKLFNVIRKDLAFDWSELGEPSEEDSGPIAAALEGESPAPFPIETPVSGSPGSASIVRVKDVKSSRLVFFGDTENLAAVEQYRIIRTKIQHHPRKPQLLLVSSPSSGDGKTVTSINLAAASAVRDGCSVLLVDGDWRRSQASRTLGIGSGAGLSEVITGQADLESSLINTEEVPNLFFLPAGGARQNTAELLDSKRWRALVQQMRARFTKVIFDAPPVESTADYALLQLICDGVVLVLRPDNSDRRTCIEAFKAIPEDKLLGVILNATQDYWFWKAPFDAYYHHKPPKS